MSKKEILIVDRLVIGYNHIVFNTAFTSIIANIYRNNDVVFICELIHGNVIADKNKDVPNLKVETFIENHLPLSNLKKIMPWVKRN